jgi:hypothetical protein
MWLLDANMDVHLAAAAAAGFTACSLALGFSVRTCRNNAGSNTKRGLPQPGLSRAFNRFPAVSFIGRYRN